jgi:hypothetical protein
MTDRVLQWIEEVPGVREGTEGRDDKGKPPPGGRELACLAKGRTHWRLSWCWSGPRAAWTGSSGRSSWSAMPWARRTPVRPRTILCPGGGPCDLARVSARLRHLARGNEILAVDHQLTPGGGPQTVATEAQCRGYVDSETAQAIVSVAGVSAKGRRLGRWLASEQRSSCS